MFAVPNGSGKSTLKTVLPPKLLGVYLNPDEILREAREQGSLRLADYGISTVNESVAQFFRNSTFLREIGLSKASELIQVREACLIFHGVALNAYVASVVTEFLRLLLVERRISFTFETVMSHPGKVEFLRQARQQGYRTYLYYIATDDPTINTNRVRNRVRQGGHDVPEDKIVKRYYASLGLLMEAIRETDRAYVFDNSGNNKASTWLAEITNGTVVEIKADHVPAWFQKSVLDRLQ